jgi:cytochrome c biogenesis protein CcmG/thiol:disulfide interchange protein DsbE
MTTTPGKRWRYAIPAALLAVLVAFFLRGLQLNPAYQESPLVCEPAAEFSLPDLADPSRRVGSADFAGRAVLLNVWATWCEGCLVEHPFLLELAASGVPIFSINWNDKREAALAWLRQRGNPYVATGVDDIGDVAIDYGVFAAPETFLISPDGTILAKRFGAMTPEVWAEWSAPGFETRCEDE